MNNNQQSMQRRNLILQAFLAGSIVAAPMMLHTSAAFAKSPAAMAAAIEGDDYLKLEKVARTEAPNGKIEVVEFFGITALTAIILNQH
jgi:hypothetical protein